MNDAAPFPAASQYLLAQFDCLDCFADLPTIAIEAEANAHLASVVAHCFETRDDDPRVFARESYAADYAGSDALNREADAARDADLQIVNQVWPWDVDKRMPVVVATKAGKKLDFMRWGIWPFYTKGRPKHFSDTCNARDDKLLSSPLWKTAVASRRCLVPADGFFEWTGPKGAKWEILFHLPDKRPFFFAGIWSSDPDRLGRGFSIITTTPNAQLATVPHDRMPVLLEKDQADGWIGEEPLQADTLKALCQPYAGTLIRVDQQRYETRPRKLRKGELLSSPDGALKFDF